MIQARINCVGKALVTLCYSLFLLLAFFSGKVCLSLGADTLAEGQTLSGHQTIASQKGIFELGFFSKGKSNDIYLGIWYKDFPEKTIVWVANREAPISNTSSNSTLKLSGGILLLFNESSVVWSANLKSSPQSSSVEAALLDNGNFVLRESSNPSSMLWQSFDHPTDTWLPGAKLGFKIIGPNQLEPQYLISWKNSDDPSPGMFSAVIDTEEAGGQILLEWNKSERYWASGIWRGDLFVSVPEMSYTAKFSLVSNPNETFFTYTLYQDAILSRLVVDASGEFKQLTAVRSIKTWSGTFTRPENKSDIYAFCGEFGVVRKLSTTSPTTCACLQGFAPFSVENERMNDGTRGCQRKSPLQCENSTSPKGKKDGFLRISNVKLPTNSKVTPLQDFAGYKTDCLEDCSCTAFAHDGNGCELWSGALMNIKELSDVTNTIDGSILYVKVANSDLQDATGDKKRLMIIIAVVVSVAGPALVGLVCLGIRKLKQKGHGNKETGQDLLSFEFSSGNNEEDSQMKNVNNRRIASKTDFDLPLFNYASVSAATNNFSVGNKLGEGGFGPVYKGKVLNGQEIAVKRLSRKSGQGLEEFRNETLLIAKLQHTNLVRLLGCCIEKDEKILIYEYMPNRSLDFFLFEPKKQVILDWGTRARIIEGIAQGLLYLHQYSRLRIIHRDLKASNILLDNEMNPKISDFGMARMFTGNNSEANTNRVVGTYGYMAPEYAMGGLSSIKSDVFSFGVLVLEIVSGKKNTGFYNSDSLNLLGRAWELWISNQALGLIDQSLGCTPPAEVTALRCINIGLLCVQENPNDRPTMSKVVPMLGNEHVALPSPKQPAFTAKAVAIKNSLTSSNADTFSANGLTVSSVEPR